MGFASLYPSYGPCSSSAFSSRRRSPARRSAAPLVLAKSSYFFVGGKIDPSVEGSPMVGQMYVEYMIPQRLRIRIRS